MFGALGIWNALDGVPRKRLSSRQCVKQAMDGLSVAKHQLYRVRVIELNRRFIHLKLKSILAHGITRISQSFPTRSGQELVKNEQTRCLPAIGSSSRNKLEKCGLDSATADLR